MFIFPVTCLRMCLRQLELSLKRAGQMLQANLFSSGRFTKKQHIILIYTVFKTRCALYIPNDEYNMRASLQFEHCIHPLGPLSLTNLTSRESFSLLREFNILTRSEVQMAVP